MARDEDPGEERQEDRLEGRRPNAPSFAVAPVRARSRLPRGVLVGAAIAVLAFVGGLAVASPGPTTRPQPLLGARPSASAGASSTGVAASAAPASATTGGTTAAAPGGTTAATASTATPAPAGPDARPASTTTGPAAGTSAFLSTFDPAAILLAAPHGARCEVGAPRQKEVPRTRRDGPRITFQRSWLAWCPMPARDRQAFLLGVLDGLEAVVPADTFGYSATRTGGGDALFPYAEPPLAGTVAVTADEAGTGYAVAIVVQEWRLDTAP